MEDRVLLNNEELEKVTAGASNVQDLKSEVRLSITELKDALEAYLLTHARSLAKINSLLDHLDGVDNEVKAFVDMYDFENYYGEWHLFVKELTRLDAPEFFTMKCYIRINNALGGAM